MFTSAAFVHLICNAYMLYKTPRPTYSRNSDCAKADMTSKIEFYVLILTGIVLYAFPDNVNFALFDYQALNNEAYRSLTRSAGAFTIAMSIASMHVFMFKYAKDRRRFFHSRICVRNYFIRIFSHLKNLIFGKLEIRYWSF